jgi:hypothetical protein
MKNDFFYNWWKQNWLEKHLITQSFQQKIEIKVKESNESWDLRNKDWYSLYKQEIKKKNINKTEICFW